jgi:hypothetical protein
LLSESLEMTLHHEVNNLIGAVVHDTVNGNGLSKILGGLGLASTSRSSRVCSQLDMESTGNGNPTLICQGCDNESGCGTHVLIGVHEGSLDLLYLCILSFIDPVVAELLLPLEIIDGADIVSSQVSYNITSMHISGNQSHNDLTLEVLEISTYKDSQSFNLLLIQVVVLVQSKHIVVSHCLNGEFSLFRPFNLSYSSNALSIVLLIHDPILTVHGHVVTECILHLLLK